MAQDRAGLHARHRAAHHVQIGAADGAGGEPHDGIGRLLQLGRRHILEPDLADIVENHCLHADPHDSRPPTWRPHVSLRSWDARNGLRVAQAVEALLLVALARRGPRLLQQLGHALALRRRQLAANAARRRRRIGRR
jgi:hypothetical protein